MASAIPLFKQEDHVNPQESLDKALVQFRRTTQEFGLTQSLIQADQQVKNIQGSALKEQDKMAAMNDISRSLTFGMLRSGANAAQIEQATAAVKPKAIQSADDAILRGTLSGDEDLVQKGLRADRLSAENKLAVLEASGKNSLKTPLGPELANIDAMDQGAMELSSMLEQVEQDSGLVGPVAGNIPGRGKIPGQGNFAAFRAQSEQFFNEYRRKITGAAASRPEMAELRKALPGLGDSPNEYKRKAKASLEIIQRHRESYMKILKAGKRDMSGFSVNAQEAAATAATAPAPGKSWEAFDPRMKK